MLKLKTMNKQTDEQNRILLIEHRTLVRNSSKKILEDADNFQIVAEADTGAKGFEFFRALNPDRTSAATTAFKRGLVCVDI